MIGRLFPSVLTLLVTRTPAPLQARPRQNLPQGNHRRSPSPSRRQSTRGHSQRPGRQSHLTGIGEPSILSAIPRRKMEHCNRASSQLTIAFIRKRALNATHD